MLLETKVANEVLELYDTWDDDNEVLARMADEGDTVDIYLNLGHIQSLYSQCLRLMQTHPDYTGA